MCGNKKRDDEHQWMTEEILEKMEHRKEHKGKDISIYKTLAREIRQERKRAKDDHHKSYNDMFADIEERDQHHNTIT